jgi:hypothetical protein
MPHSQDGVSPNPTSALTNRVCQLSGHPGEGDVSAPLSSPADEVLEIWPTPLSIDHSVCFCLPVFAVNKSKILSI